MISLINFVSKVENENETRITASKIERHFMKSVTSTFTDHR